MLASLISKNVWQVSVAVLLDKFIKTSDRLAEEERERRRELKRSKERVKCMLDPLLERLTAVGTGTGAGGGVGVGVGQGAASALLLLLQTVMTLAMTRIANIIVGSGRGRWRR